MPTSASTHDYLPEDDFKSFQAARNQFGLALRASPNLPLYFRALRGMNSTAFHTLAAAVWA
eukprot:scaffold245545_cov13-Tisochrysis_lutea.AAC.1